MRLVTTELKAKTYMVHCRTEIAGARLDLSPRAEDYAVEARPPFHAQHTPDIVGLPRRGAGAKPQPFLVL